MGISEPQVSTLQTVREEENEFSRKDQHVRTSRVQLCTGRRRVLFGLLRERIGRRSHFVPLWSSWDAKAAHPYLSEVSDLGK